MKIIKENQMKISRWGGGVTKELYIYPEDAEYSLRNFKFRISIATTESESSTFTRLSGVKRVLSILQGEMVISHKDYYEKKLLPYEIDRFMGDWETTAKGKVADFNLMIKESQGNFFFKEIIGNFPIDFPEVEGIFFIYSIQGDIRVKDKILKTGELFLDEKGISEVFSEKAKIFYGYVEVNSK